MKTIYKRELRSYFLSPIAYIFMGSFMLIAGIFFSLSNIIQLSVNFSTTLGSLTFVFMIIVPILTMRLLSQEQKDKTDQLLFTSPISITNIVLGKFFAAVTVFIATLFVSLLFPFIISLFGTPVFGEILTAYIGFFLLGASMIALGMLVSSLTDSQVIAGISTASLMLIMWVSNAAITLIPNKILANILAWFSLFDRVEPFILGKLSITPIIYYLSFIFAIVFATCLNIDKRRWS